MASPNINSDEDVTQAAGRSVSATLEKARRNSPILRDHVFAETRSEDSAIIKKRIIFADLVSEEGFTWILRETGVFVKFLPKAVPDPRLVTCSLWKSGIVCPPLEDYESLVSNVIELDCDDPHDVVFSSIEVALTHSANCLRGYELVMKEMTDAERWRDLETPEVKPSDLQGGSSQWITELPFVHAKVTSFSRYAVICRLKSYKIRKEDSVECLELAISVPDFPGTCLSIPGSSFPESMDFVAKVQEVSSDAFEGKGVLVGPVVHIKFTPYVKLSDPSQVSLNCPVLINVAIDLQERQITLSKMSSRHVRVFFRGGKDTSRKWVDWTKKLRPPPKLENGIVTFEVDGTDTFQTNCFLECGVILDSSAKPMDAGELFIVDSSCPQQVGFFAFWSQREQKEKESTQEPKQGSLTLCCFPIHMKTELRKEILSKHGYLLCGEAESARQLAKGDQAFFSLSNGLIPVDEGVDIDYTPVTFTGDSSFEANFSARFEVPTIEFFKRENDKEGREKLCSLLLHPVAPFEYHSPVIYRETSQSQKQPPVCEPSPSVESPVEDSAEELGKTIVTQRIAVRCKEDIGNCWKDLGAILDFRESELRNIEMDYFHARDRGLAVLESWMNKEGRKASVKRLVDALIEIRMKGKADNLLDVVREEKRRQSQQKGDRPEKFQETCGSPAEDETGQHQASEREGSSEAMSSTSEEVNASRTRNIEQSERRDETGSEQTKLDELRETLQKVIEMGQAVTRIKSRVDELPRIQQNTRKNEPFEMMRSLLVEVDAFKEVIEQNILEGRAGNENVEGLRQITEKVRKAKIDFSGAS